MANQKWIFGSVCLVAGFVIGHFGSRPGNSTGQPAAGQSAVAQPAPGMAGIPLSITAPTPPVKEPETPEEPETLKLTDVSFCQKITNFGNFTRFPHDEFAADQEVLIYAAIEGLQSEEVEDGKYRTIAKSTIDVYRAGDARELVERIDLPESVDLCRRRRLDYFHSYELRMPDNLAAGDYILKLTVQDNQSDRQASRELAFSVK